MNAVLLTGFISSVLTLASAAAEPTTQPARSGPTVRVVVEVIEAELNATAAETLDVQTIDPEHDRIDQLLAALRKSGQAALSTRLDGQIIADRTVSLRTSQRMPVVVGSSVRGGGNIATQISYQDIGTKCKLFVHPLPKDRSFNLEGQIEWRGLAATDIAISEGANAVSSLGAEMEVSCTLKSGEPALMSTMMMLPKPKEGPEKTYVVIYRITVTGPVAPTKDVKTKKVP